MSAGRNGCENDRLFLGHKRFRGERTRHRTAMAEVRVVDNYYLAITLLITIGYQLFFLIAFSLKFDKLTSMFPDP